VSFANLEMLRKEFKKLGLHKHKTTKYFPLGDCDMTLTSQLFGDSTLEVMSWEDSGG